MSQKMRAPPIAASIFARVADAFPPGYQQDFSAEQAVDDLARLDGLSEGQLSMRLWTEDMEFRVLPDPVPPRAREPVLYKVVVRDRAEAYAEAARLGAPTALQVADRFHLLHNLADTLTQVFTAHAPALAQLKAQCTAAPTPVHDPTDPAAAPEPSSVPRNPRFGLRSLNSETSAGPAFER